MTAYMARLIDCNKETTDKRKAAAACVDLTLSLWGLNKAVASLPYQLHCRDWEHNQETE